MKNFILLALLVSTNAFASQQSADLYTILKEAGIPEKGNGVLAMDQERVFGIYCRQEMQSAKYVCSLDRDDENGEMIKIQGESARKMFKILGPADFSCNKESCGFFIDAVQCFYTLDNSVPLSKRSNCNITSTREI